MDNKQDLAYGLYDTMMYNFKRHLRGGVDKHSAYNKFLNAAVALAQLDAPNPFGGHTEITDNAAAKPTKVGQKVTGVFEK